MFHHQQHHYYWYQLCRIARYEPGGEPGTARWHAGTWVPREPDADEEAQR